MNRPIAVVAAAALLLAIPAAARDEAVVVDVGDTKLHGTLELPRRDPIAAAVIISGSGPTDRDGNSAILPGKNNSLRYLAEALADKRIASLRYDKRMIGESANQNIIEADLRFDHFADDAVKLAAYLGERTDVPVFLIGHSEGGQIALTAAEREAFAGVAVLAGPGEHPADLIASQLARQIPPDLFEDSVRTLDALRAGNLVDDPPAQLSVLFRKSIQPYLVSWFRYDPPKQAANIDEPLLLIYGTTDIQVDVSNGEALAAAHADARLVIIEGMNHVLKMVSGTPAEQMPSYSDPDLPLADGVARAITSFVTETTTRSP
ncbi:MAG: alpha/beta fold hydrolase [Pseudomonadota bacterium]